MFEELIKTIAEKYPEYHHENLQFVFAPCVSCFCSYYTIGLRMTIQLQRNLRRSGALQGDYSEKECVPDEVDL